MSVTTDKGTKTAKTVSCQLVARHFYRTPPHGPLLLSC